MAEEESARLLELKRQAEHFRELAEFENVHERGKSFLEHPDLSDEEKAWGLYYLALGQKNSPLAKSRWIAIEDAHKNINKAIDLFHNAPEFFNLRASILISKKNNEEAENQIRVSRNLTDTLILELPPKRFLSITYEQANLLNEIGKASSAQNILSTGINYYYIKNIDNKNDQTMGRCLIAYDQALTIIKQNEDNKKIAQQNEEIIKLKEALDAAKIVDNPEQINEDFAERILTSATRLAALRRITERNSKYLTFFVTLVILSSLSLQLFVPLISDQQEPSPYFYITVTTGTILIVSSIFYQLRQANHNERVELHLHEDLQRKKTLMLYATSITTEDRAGAQKQIIDHFDFRGTPEQLADLYHKGKGQPKADDQLEKIAQAIKDISKNQ